jgi:hypothetical protein
MAGGGTATNLNTGVFKTLGIKSAPSSRYDQKVRLLPVTPQMGARRNMSVQAFKNATLCY